MPHGDYDRRRLRQILAAERAYFRTNADHVNGEIRDALAGLAPTGAPTVTPTGAPTSFVDRETLAGLILRTTIDPAAAADMTVTLDLAWAAAAGSGQRDCSAWQPVSLTAPLQAPGAWTLVLRCPRTRADLSPPRLAIALNGVWIETVAVLPRPGRADLMQMVFELPCPDARPATLGLHLDGRLVLLFEGGEES